MFLSKCGSPYPRLFKSTWKLHSIGQFNFCLQSISPCKSELSEHPARVAMVRSLRRDGLCSSQNL